MKKFLLLLISTTFICFYGCSTGVAEIASIGKPYEIFVVTPKTLWNGAAGDTLRSVLQQEVLWVNQPEPQFDIFNITPQAFNNNVRSHRNLIFLDTSTKTDTVQFMVRKDLWATNQLVINITAPTDSVAANFISENRDVIVRYLEIVESERMVKRAQKYNEPQLEDRIAKKFDLEINIPRGYRLALDTTNFIWITYEMPLASQGVIIYSFEKPSDPSQIQIIAQRDSAVKRIPGPVKNSFMATDTAFYPESNPVNINGQAWIETRGFWFVKGDFMGGPFINYLTFDDQNQKYIGVDMYLYSPSPRYPKRNYIRQLEAIIKSVQLDRSAK